jgi:hypothetical protein
MSEYILSKDDLENLEQSIGKYSTQKINIYKRQYDIHKLNEILLHFFPIVLVNIILSYTENKFLLNLITYSDRIIVNTKNIYIDDELLNINFVILHEIYNNELIYCIYLVSDYLDTVEIRHQMYTDENIKLCGNRSDVRLFINKFMKVNFNETNYIDYTYLSNNCTCTYSNKKNKANIKKWFNDELISENVLRIKDKTKLTYVIELIKIFFDIVKNIVEKK